MSNMYLVTKFWHNDGSYEDFVYGSSVIGVCDTEERSMSIIKEDYERHKNDTETWTSARKLEYDEHDFGKLEFGSKRYRGMDSVASYEHDDRWLFEKYTYYYRIASIETNVLLKIES